MSEDRNEANPTRKRGKNDKEYYEDLYNDLPKEVVDILMKTHPLANKEGEGTVSSRSRKRPSREDVEEVREARMQQVATEIDEIRQSPQQEGDPTRYVSRRARNIDDGSMEEMDDSALPGRKLEQDDYDDGIQYVSVMPSRKKSKMMEGNTMQPTTKKKKVTKDEVLFEDFSTSSRPRYEEMDFEEKAKQEHLDSLYDDDYDDDEYRGTNKLAIVLGVIAIIIIGGLIFKCVSLSSQLEEAKNQATVNQELSGKYEKVQLEKMQLEEELAKLKDPDGTATSGAGTGTTGTDTTGTDTGTTGTDTTGAAGSTTEYVVQDGDTGWSIAQKVYGNGAEFQKILDANNLKESDTISIGSKLKIPK